MPNKRIMWGQIFKKKKNKSYVTCNRHMRVVEQRLDLILVRKYFTKKKTAATKVVKTVQSHNQAMKSAEKRAKQAMRDVNTIARIVKQRKVYWFEKFFWFVSSENYLVIAGRDQQQVWSLKVCMYFE